MRPEVLVQLRNELVADVDSFNVLEDNTKHPEWLGCGGPSESTGRGMQEEIRQRTREAPEVPGRGWVLKPLELETRKGRDPGNRTGLGWRDLTGKGPGRLTWKLAAYEWGVLSGIVLGAWESHAHVEGPDGSTKLAKETHAGQVGSDKLEPTSLRAIAYRLGTGNSVDLRGCEYNRGTGCGKTAPPGLCGGAPGNQRSYRARLQNVLSLR